MKKLYEEYDAPIVNTADKCGVCKSDRIVTSQNGFDATLMIKWIVWTFLFGILCAIIVPFIGGLMAVVSILFGFFVGIILGAKNKGKVINMCANCGNKWEPGK